MGECGKKRVAASEVYGEGSASLKKLRPPATEPEINCQEMESSNFARLFIGDDMDAELMKLLEEEAAAPPPIFAVKFIQDPYSPPEIFQSPSYVTINGNEETCGSSFSDFDASVMASASVSAFPQFMAKIVPDSGGAWSSRTEEVHGDACKNDDDGTDGSSKGAGAWEAEIEKVRGDAWKGKGKDGGNDGGAAAAGCGWDWDDEMVARFLGEDVKDFDGDGNGDGNGDGDGLWWSSIACPQD